MQLIVKLSLGHEGILILFLFCILKLINILFYHPFQEYQDYCRTCAYDDYSSRSKFLGDMKRTRNSYLFIIKKEIEVFN